MGFMRGSRGIGSSWRASAMTAGRAGGDSAAQKVLADLTDFSEFIENR